jgi:hypothetical protein
MPIFLKSGILNLLEGSEPVKACNGIALPYQITVILYNLYKFEKKIFSEEYVGFDPF